MRCDRYSIIGLFVLLLSVLSTQACISQSGLDPVLIEGQQLFEQKRFREVIDMATIEYEAFFEKGKETEGFEMLLLLAKGYMHQYTIDSCLIVYEEIVERGGQLGQKEYKNNALQAIAQVKMFKGEANRALELYREVLTLNPSDQHRSNSYTGIANSHAHFGRDDSALKYINLAIDLDRSNSDSSSLPFNLSKKAEIYTEQARNKEAIELYLEGISWLREETDDFKLASFNFSIANLFFNEGDLIKARRYVSKGIAIANSKKMPSTGADLKSQLGFILLAEGKVDSARLILTEALEFFKGNSKNQRIVKTATALAELEMKAGDTAKAREILKQTDDLAASVSGVVVSKRKLVWADLLSKSDLMASLKLINEVKSNLHEIEEVDKLGLYRLEHSVLKGLGRYEESLNSLQKYLRLKENMDEKAQQRLVFDLEAKYDKAEKDKEIAQLDSKNYRQQALLKSKEQQLKGGVVFSIVLFSLGLFMLHQFRLIKRINSELSVQKEQLKKSLDDKELLLREIHHRVKNNLQVVSSLLSIQSREIHDSKALEAVNESRNRVKSMSLIHQNLYQEDNLKGIKAKDYVTKLTTSLFNSYRVDQGRVSLVTEIEDLNLDVDTTIPLGLILNELLTNSLKYAFPEQTEGEIKVSLREHEGQLELVVSDTGVGIKESSEEKADSFGMKMIKAFSKKLDAEWEVRNENGTVVELKIMNYKIAS